MHSISYDLHIHTCLSPCGDNDNTPANIIGMAALKGLDVIAITDHNTARNCPPAIELGKEYGVTVIPGMELTTMEEIHVLCLFPELDAALDFDRFVYERLQKIANKPEIFGHQYCVDEGENILYEEQNLLINATDIPFDGVDKPVRERGGVMIPAHLDKPTTSLLSSLGFVPEGSTFNTFELKDMKNLHRIRSEHPYLEGCRVITDSDAHYLEHINEPVNFLEVREKGVKGIIKALSEPLRRIGEKS